MDTIYSLWRPALIEIRLLTDAIGRLKIKLSDLLFAVMDILANKKDVLQPDRINKQVVGVNLSTLTLS